MRTETIAKKEDSDLKLPQKSNRKYTQPELHDLVIRLAEAHGLI